MEKSAEEKRVKRRVKGCRERERRFKEREKKKKVRVD